MDILTLLISRVNDVLWTYILIIMLLGCAFWFKKTFKTNFVTIPHDKRNDTSIR